VRGKQAVGERRAGKGRRWRARGGRGGLRRLRASLFACWHYRATSRRARHIFLHACWDERVRRAFLGSHPLARHALVPCRCLYFPGHFFRLPSLPSPSYGSASLRPSILFIPPTVASSLSAVELAGGRAIARRRAYAAARYHAACRLPDAEDGGLLPCGGAGVTTRCLARENTAALAVPLLTSLFACYLPLRDDVP